MAGAHAAPARITSGSAAPSVGAGANGDLYLRTSTGGWYQKQSGAWVLVVDLATQAELDAFINGGSVPHVSTTDPSTVMASGTEYVWFKMDGAGVLLDILYGKKA